MMGTRNNNDSIKKNNDGDDVQHPCISQDKLEYAAVTNKPTISVAKVYCLLMLVHCMLAWGGGGGKKEELLLIKLLKDLVTKGPRQVKQLPSQKLLVTGFPGRSG